MDLEVIAKIAAGEMANKRSFPHKSLGDKYHHGQRVATLALRLRQILFPQLTDKDELLTVAAWFHDIYNGHEEYHKIHGEKGAELVRQLLANHCTAAELGEICGIIAIHDERPIETDSVALKLHQDADHLDHFGTDEIVEECSYSAVHDKSRTATITELQERYEMKSVIWKSQLHFELSRRIYDEKREFVRTFVERFKAELGGEIWNEAQLLAGWDGSI